MATSISLEVDRPAPEVFEYVTDPSRFSEWQHGVVDGHWHRDGPGSVGDRCVNTRQIGFAQRQVTSEITGIDPPSTWSVRGLDGPIRAAVEVNVEPPEEGKRSKGDDHPGLHRSWHRQAHRPARHTTPSRQGDDRQHATTQATPRSERLNK